MKTKNKNGNSLMIAIANIMLAILLILIGEHSYWEGILVGLNITAAIWNFKR